MAYKTKEGLLLYRERTKEQTKERNRLYHLKNKERIKEKKRIYYKNNKHIGLAYKEKHKEKYIQYALDLRKRNIESWYGYIPMKAYCEICGKTLYFQKKLGKGVSLHFDHKTDNLPIKMHPTHFLFTRFRNEKNQALWESCDFGILCTRCNMHLPTINRKEYLMKVIKYVFGEGSVITNGAKNGEKGV